MGYLLCFSLASPLRNNISTSRPTCCVLSQIVFSSFLLLLLSYVKSGSFPLANIEQDLQNNLVSINLSQPGPLHAIKIHNATNLRCGMILLSSIACLVVIMAMRLMIRAGAVQLWANKQRGSLKSRGNIYYLSNSFNVSVMTKKFVQPYYGSIQVYCRYTRLHFQKSVKFTKRLFGEVQNLGPHRESRISFSFKPEC